MRMQQKWCITSQQFTDSLNKIKAAFIQHIRVVQFLQGPKKLSIKNFCSDLFTSSIHNFECIWIQYICKLCLVYHLIDLGASR